MDKLAMSFDGCPNRCVGGYYIDPYLHKRVKCVYCEGRRLQEVRDGGVSGEGGVAALLNLPESYGGLAFDVGTVFPGYSLKYLTEDSVVAVRDAMVGMVSAVSVGDLPGYSCLFNLGKKAYGDNFVYALLTRAYVAGKTVSPYMSALEVVYWRNSLESGADGRYLGFLRTDLCAVVLDAGCTPCALGAVKGLMQMRAHYGKPTVILTNWWGSQIYDLCSEEGESSLSLATLVSVEYRDTGKSKKQKGAPRGVSEMGVEEFEGMMGSRVNL